jgi:DNA-3-methyladenine glycosylase I
MKRCEWVNNNPLMIKYHDEEWGTPCYDDSTLFEYLILDMFQAGLSWELMINKRENFRKAFDGFNYKKIAKYDEKKKKNLMNDEGIVRNRLKIDAAINNAKRFLDIQKEFGSFSNYLWRFVNNKRVDNKFNKREHIPTNTPLSDKISKDLKKRGFKFVGSTTFYAYLQGIGMVNDHTINCFRYRELT